MNNKGFAITSVVYGLSVLGMMIIVIMMGTISSSRKNVTEQAEHVEEFVTHLNQADGVYTSSTTYRVPKGESGWYRVEAFGKNVGSNHGSYTTGIIYAKEETVYKIVINNTYSAITTQSDKILMRAAAATSSAQGGGLNYCYSAPPIGASIEEDQQLTPGTTLTGIDEITFSDTGCNLSFIMGYPGQSDRVYNETDYFVDGLILPGASGVTAGKVLITRLAEKSEDMPDLPRRNTTLNSVSKIEVKSDDTSIKVKKIYYSYHVTSGSGYRIYVKSCNNPCSISLSKNMDEITVFFENEKTVLNSTEIILNGDSNKVLYNSKTNGYGVEAGPNGLHFSAYQPDSNNITNNIPDHGNYYIIPVTMGTKILTAQTDLNSPLQVDYLTGDIKQKWAIDLIDGSFPNITNTSGVKEYRIMELSRYKAMNVLQDENRIGSLVASNDTFNSLSRNNPQIWNVTARKNNTYSIKTVLSSFASEERSGFLYAKPTDNLISIGKAQNPTAANDASTEPTTVERFYLYSIDFAING